MSIEPLLSHLSAADPVLSALMRAVGPCLLVPELDCEPFQALAQAIAHQQLHGTAARTILRRFVDTCGRGVFPSAERVLATPDQTLRAAGFSGPKIAALKDLAKKTIAGIVPERKQLMQLEDSAVIERLTQVRGIGRWTVEMLLIFQLGRPDVLPVDDFGVRNGFRLAYGLSRMPHPRALAAYGERWSPYRSTAAWYLWRAVELQRAGGLPRPAERIRLPRISRRRAAAKKTQRPKAGASRRAVRKRPVPGRAKPASSALRRRVRTAASKRRKAR
jgi:DNA-3-methyladenine glycosylase II